ncbi:MAG: DNA mismatch repair endonuclease MutL [Thermomicrobiales bacterium]|nr:DNA mismatch repair endonuclease MutL [Thermomicrobiales bacterium]
MAIRVLPPALVQRIAAGEVITQPRAAVRELIDNALDADSTRVEIEIVSGGYDLIVVHDNGHGIAAEDGDLLFARHATSKLASADGLDAVRTLGFRGEALASLAAVGDVEVSTRHADEQVGFRLTSGGALSPLARQTGTTVTVRQLFSRYPVRREAATPVTEARAIRRLITQLALIRPKVSWVLRVDGRMVLLTTGGGLRNVLMTLEGDKARHLLDLGPLDVDGVRIQGLADGPNPTSGRSDGILLSVNGRLCDVPELRRAIARAYAEVLPRQRTPRVILTIEVDPARVDANVHPAKERVAIHDVAAITGPLFGELRAMLGRTAHSVSGQRSLALDLGRLTSSGMAEDRGHYAANGWQTRNIPAGSLPALRVVGQIADTLIVCESEIGTLLIDQHRAHERVIYERLMAGESVEADEPVRIAIPPRFVSALEACTADALLSGWRWTEFGLDDVLVTAAPVDMEPADLPDVLAQLSAEPKHDIAAAAACHAALRKRRPLSPTTAVALIEALTQTRTPATCPHGQPIVLNLDHDFLERQFGWR